jgi:hypothetical protein
LTFVYSSPGGNGAGLNGVLPFLSLHFIARGSPPARFYKSPLSTTVASYRVITMASKSGPKPQTTEKATSASMSQTFQRQDIRLDQPNDYSSEGVEDNDIFLLPGTDFQVLGVLTVIAVIVRLFRIYQPSSVVFDEVQSV